jgi:hypothetical protein
MNLTMLRGTIQTMEVQRATLAALKSMGSSMAEAMRQSGASAEKMGMSFGPFFGQPATGAGAGGGTAQPGAAAQDPAGAAAGMPAALAWWNMLQDQFTQAVATAMTPADGVSKAESQAEAPAAPPQQQPPQQAQQQRPPQQPKAQQPAADAPAAGNGKDKERGSKPKADNK